jgi:hypothetical protein
MKSLSPIIPISNYLILNEIDFNLPKEFGLFSDNADGF